MSNTILITQNNLIKNKNYIIFYDKIFNTTNTTKTQLETYNETIKNQIFKIKKNVSKTKIDYNFVNRLSKNN